MRTRDAESKKKQTITRATEKHAAQIDLSKFPQLRAMAEFTGKFLGDELPSVIDCQDAAHLAYTRADALLTYCADADAGLDALDCCHTEPIEGWVIDAVKLQLEQLYVATVRLGEIHDRVVPRGEIQD